MSSPRRGSLTLRVLDVLVNFRASYIRSLERISHRRRDSSLIDRTNRSSSRPFVDSGFIGVAAETSKHRSELE